MDEFLPGLLNRGGESARLTLVEANEDISSGHDRGLDGKLFAVRKYQSVESDFGVMQRRKIAGEHCRDTLPFSDGVQPRDFAENFRTGRDHFPVKDVYGIDYLAVDRRVQFLGYLLR